MNIYVGNLANTAKENELRELFEQYGTVHSAKIINDRDTGEPRGFGFIEMSENSGRKAIAELNGQEFQNMELVVNESRPKPNNRDRRNTGRRSY